MKHTLLFIILFAFLGLGICQPKAVLTSTSCVDPDGLEKCLDEAGHASYDDNPPQERECTKYIRNYECYAKHCWNRVYECEYQMYIIDYLSECNQGFDMKPGDIPSIPYFPAPKDAPDSCSCNFGTVYGAVRAINRQASSCLNNIKLAPSIAVSGSKNFQDENGKFDKESFSQFLCECDETEAALSSFSTLCGGADPFWSRDPGLFQLALLKSSNQPFCSKFLMKYGGVKGLNFSAVTYDGTPITFLDPHVKFSSLVEAKYGNLNNLDLHSPFTTQPGTVTAPPSGTVFAMSVSRIDEHTPTHKETITAAGKASRIIPVIEAREDPCLSKWVRPTDKWYLEHCTNSTRQKGDAAGWPQKTTLTMGILGAALALMVFILL